MDANVYLQPGVQATEINDPTKTHKIKNGRGSIELQARDTNSNKISTKEGARCVILVLFFNVINSSSNYVFQIEFLRYIIA